MRFIDLGQPINRASPLNYGLVSWWKVLNQGPHFGGARFLDLANRNHGTLTNGPTWSGLSHPGGWGSLKFSNTNPAQEVTVATTPAATATFTISVVMHPLAEVPTSSSNKLGLHTGSGAPGPENNATNFSLRFWDGANTLVSNNNGWVPFAWNMAHFVGDGTNLRFYSNGRPWGSTASGRSCGGPTAIGRYFTTGSYDGHIADYRFRARALSDSEVAADFLETWSVHQNTLNWQRRLTYFDTGAAPPAGNRRRRVLICGAAA